MGVVIRQSIKFTIINLVLVIIGGLSVLYVYPNNLLLYGEFNLLFFIATLFIPLTSMGFSNVILKYHYRYKETGKADKFLSFCLLGTNIFAFIGLSLFVLCKPLVLDLLDIYNLSKGFIDQNYLWIVFLSFLIINNGSLINYSSIHKRIVIPELISTGGYKLLIPVLIIISTMYSLMSFHYFTIIIIFFIVVFLSLLWYVSGLQNWSLSLDLSVLSRIEKLEGALFMLLSSINNFFYQLILKIDLILVGLFLSPVYAGIYAIFIFLVSLIEIPGRSITQISTPLISQYLLEDDKKELNRLYTGTSLSLFIIGSFIFFIILFNFNYLFQYIGKIPMEPAFTNVILFLGLSRLIDISFGLNSQIILFSKRFYVYNILTVCTGIFNLILSYYFIKSAGMQGVALSVLISIFIFNILKFLYIWYEMKLSPLSNGHGITSIAVIITFIIWSYFPIYDNLFLGVCISSFFVCAVFFILVYYFKPSILIYDTLLKYRNNLIQYFK